MARRALILGAGGHAAIAWEIGFIFGLAENGIDVRNADLFVGTSAGSVAGAQITSGLALEALFERQVKPELQSSAAAVSVDFNQWRTSLLHAKEAGGAPAEILTRVGAIAIATPNASEIDRRREIASRLPVEQWPEQRLLIVAVDTATGERRAFDRASGVTLLDAIAASCAVPGIWPAVPIQGRRYMDGGVYSIDNADLAHGCDCVLILTLKPRVPSMAVVSLDSAVERLRGAGAHVQVVMPDEASEQAFASVGGNLLDPAVRESAAIAGRRQGQLAAQSFDWI